MVAWWLDWAHDELGQAELPGADSNARIIAYRTIAHVGEKDPTEDSKLPWCAIFANAALEAVGVRGTGSALALSFAHSNSFVQLGKPSRGALTVLWRIAQNSGHGHVGFYLGEDATHVYLLGGNQHDRVSIAKFPKAGATMGLVAHYWPQRLSTPTDLGPLPPVTEAQETPVV